LLTRERQSDFTLITASFMIFQPSELTPVAFFFAVGYSLTMRGEL